MTGDQSHERPTPADTGLLLEAIELAAVSLKSGDLPYGSVLADASGTILDTAHNTVRSENDITARPELVLARRAAASMTREDCARLTLYTSCEPCPMCRNAITRAHLGRVVYALSTEQLHELQDDHQPRPDSAAVTYAGPTLFGKASEPIIQSLRP